MSSSKRSLFTSAVVHEDGSRKVVYSFSPSRFKFWLGVVIMFFTLGGLVMTAQSDMRKGLQNWVQDECTSYFTLFHKQLREEIKVERKIDIDTAIASHTAESEAVFNAEIRALENKEAEHLADIKANVAANQATLNAMRAQEEHQTRLLEDIIKRLPN
jgi:hypothetical protein